MCLCVCVLCAHNWMSKNEKERVKHYNLFSLSTMLLVPFSIICHTVCRWSLWKCSLSYVCFFIRLFVLFLSRQLLAFHRVCFFSAFTLMKIYFCWNVWHEIFRRWLCGNVELSRFSFFALISCRSLSTSSKSTALNSLWQFGFKWNST